MIAASINVYNFRYSRDELCRYVGVYTPRACVRPVRSPVKE